jgi:guanyl-specific ribonuclease Sa
MLKHIMELLPKVIKEYKNEPRGNAQKLPTTTTYKEYDIYPKIDGIKRGTERIVLGADRSAGYTSNHYFSFVRFDLGG